MIRGGGTFIAFMPLIPLFIFGGLFALGWFLNPDTLRIIWLSISGIFVALIIIAWIAMAIMFYRVTRFFRRL